MPAKLIFSLICDDAREEISRKLIVIGLYNYRINVTLPNPPVRRNLPDLRSLAQGQGQPRPKGLEALRKPEEPVQRLALPQICVVRKWFVDLPGQIARTELIEPNGERRLLTERELPVSEPDGFFQEIIRIAGFLLSQGEYKVRTSIGDYVNEEPFFVKIG